MSALESSIKKRNLEELEMTQLLEAPTILTKDPGSGSWNPHGGSQLSVLQARAGVSDPLKVELQTVMRCHVGAENWNCVLQKGSHLFSPSGHLI